MQIFFRFLSRFVMLLLVLGPIGQTHAASQTATVSISPSSGSQIVGKNFTVSVKVTTGGQSINAAGIKITYSSNLDYVSADSAGSVLDTSTADPSPSNNSFRFERLGVGSAYNGSDGLLLKLTFKPNASGAGTVTIDKSNSEVLAESDSSNVLNSVSNAAFSLDSAAPPPPPAAKTTAKATTTPSPTPSPTPTATPTSEPTPLLTPTPIIITPPIATSRVAGSAVYIIPISLLLLAVLGGELWWWRKLQLTQKSQSVSPATQSQIGSNEVNADKINTEKGSTAQDKPGLNNEVTKTDNSESEDSSDKV